MPTERLWTHAMVALAAILAVGIAMVTDAPTAWAHGGAAISVTSEPVVGGIITVEGQQFEAGDQVTLTLVGLVGELPLGSVKAGEVGNFRFESGLPPTVYPGWYQVKARGKDATALANIRVLASRESAPVLEHAGSVDFHSGASPRTMAALGVVVALLAGGGFALAFLPRFLSASSSRR